MMTPNIFMSYSRREVGFVDDLTHRLEKAGFNVWLDYRRLIPGTPWAGQIDKGLREAEVVLLVVSQDSIASQFVELEWRHVLNDKNKRIILVIFEALKLPPELKNYEWVDFRGSYESGIKELIGQLNSPIQEAHPVPESGFKAPFIVWLTAMLSCVAGFYSLFAIWTILLPVILIPLAWRVFKRNYNFAQVQTALWMLPVGLLLSGALIMEFSDLNVDTMNIAWSFFWGAQVFIIPAVVIALILILHSQAMQRWGKPEANKTKFANRYSPNNPNPSPIKFFIDHAPQDKLSAADISKGLTKYRHSPAADIKSAQAVFVLISRFKTDTEADPEQQAVYPVLIQTALPSEKLSHVQWIDFRKGIRNLDALAQLLPQPENMLAALGVRPANGAQVITPGIITTMINFLLIIIIMGFGSLATYPIELLGSNLMDILGQNMVSIAGIIFQQALCMALAGVLIYFMVKALIGRQGWLASIPAFLMAQGILFLLFGWQTYQVALMDDLFQSNGIVSKAVFASVPFIFYGVGLFFVNLFALFRFGDIRRWFPAKAKG